MIAWLAVCFAQEPSNEPPPADDPGVAAPVRAQLDWQAHPTMHLTWKLIFGRGLTDRSPKRRYEHQFKQVVFEPYLAASGVRILLAGAMAAEQARNPRQARRLILAQLRYVEDFVAANPDRYALARSPEEVRAILSSTSKMAVVHSIEGGHEILRDPDDARFWADQGVALITLIHLRDDELGGAGILPTKYGTLVNRAGAKARRRGLDRGLTPRGEAAIVELADAGILVDFAHMAPDTVDDALAITAAHGIPPVNTHGKLRVLHDSELGWTDAQVLELYRQGGHFAFGLAGAKLDPVAPTAPVPADLCEGTLDSWRLHYETLNALLAANRGTLLPPDTSDVDAQIRLSVGWSSDWNGWVSHSAPVYGKGRCRPLSTLSDPLPIDTEGLAHPGLLPSHWERLSRDGADLEPVLYSAERFLQLWEQVRAR